MYVLLIFYLFETILNYILTYFLCLKVYFISNYALVAFILFILSPVTHLSNLFYLFYLQLHICPIYLSLITVIVKKYVG